MFATLAAALVCLGQPGSPQPQPPVKPASSPSQSTPDLNELRKRVQTGGTLTPEERQIVQRAQQQQMQQRRKLYLQDHAPQSSVGFTALTDLGKGTHKDAEGGLYPGGANTPPAAHVQKGVDLARMIRPLDKEGRPSSSGKIVMLSIGFSNPNIEFPAFQQLASADPALNPNLLTVNGCVGGQASSVIADSKSNYWNMVLQHLQSAGSAAGQVQVVWVKLVVPGSSGSFEEEAKKLQSHLTATLQNIHDKFPNVKLAYLTSRTYGGFTEVGGSPEPWAYEGGFAVKWTVADQLSANPALNFDPAKGTVRAPWAAWGPYIWTDGVKGRKDGFVYTREDLAADGLHPSDKGKAKVAALMMDFFRSDPTSRPWFLK